MEKPELLQPFQGLVMRCKRERLGKLEGSLKLDSLEAGPNNHRKPVLVKDSIPTAAFCRVGRSTSSGRGSFAGNARSYQESECQDMVAWRHLAHVQAHAVDNSCPTQLERIFGETGAHLSAVCQICLAAKTGLWLQP